MPVDCSLLTPDPRQAKFLAKLQEKSSRGIELLLLLLYDNLAYPDTEIGSILKKLNILHSGLVGRHSGNFYWRMEEITYGDNSCYGAVKRSLGKAWKAQNLSFTEVGVGKSKTKRLMVVVAAFDEMC